MNSFQDSVQVQELPSIPSSPLLSQGSPSRTRYATTEENVPSSASKISIPAPAGFEEATETDNREPLKERNENASDNQESSEPSKEEGQEEGVLGSEKLNEYVAKVLEKLLQQKEKATKMSSILEKSGLLSDKNNTQIQKMIQNLENILGENSNENTTEDNSPSKENLSPVKAKPVSTKTTSPKIPTKRSGEKYTVEEVLEVSRKEIDYGYRFPGQIVEESLEIVNKSKHDFVVQIFVNCLNDELQDTDEYVYSVRRSHLYDYNDKHYLIMAPYSCASFKFALKVPNLKINGKIMGQVKVGIQGLTGNYLLDLTTQVSIPKVFCPKELKCNGLDYKVIKVAVKEGKKSELKIPIRNNGNVPVTLELEFYEPNNGSETQEKPMFDCMVHPNVITVNPNSQTLTSILIKPWKIMMGVQALNKPKPVRKILTARVRDSALVYSFVFWVEFY